MTYKAEKGDLTATFGGDTMLTRRLAVYDEPEFLGLAELFRKSDVGFANLESTVRHWDEGIPSITQGTYSTMNPQLLEDFRWFGLNLLSCANNHAFDYGEGGVMATVRHLDAAGFAHAGTGANLAKACAPGYLDTPRGRIALVSATSAFRPWNRAARQRPDMPGRSGVNAIGFETRYTIDTNSFAEMRRMSAELGFDKARERAKTHFFSAKEIGAEGAKEIDIFGSHFSLGNEFATLTEVNQGDLTENLKWIREARRQADWVVFSLHFHEFGGKSLKTATTKVGVEEPADFVTEAAHAAIDAGADVVAGHGSHTPLGIEIYKGKPIFYSLGNFVFQNDTVPFFPSEAYERFDLGPEATASDFIDARTGGGKKGHAAYAGFWENIAVECTYKGHKLHEMRVHPIHQGFGLPPAQRGRPVMAKGELAEKILSRMARLSKAFGCEIKVKDGIGRIALD